MFESGVKSYIKARYVVEIGFPVDLKGNAKVCCDMCRMYRSSTMRCMLNDEVCEYPRQYIGSHCPLIFDENTDENQNDELF